MNAGLVVAIAVGGSVILLGGIAWVTKKLTGAFAPQSDDRNSRLAEELTRRGWTYGDYDESCADIHNAQPVFRARNMIDPLASPPKAVGARDVISGTHRSRPFIATQFDVRQQGEQVFVTAIWLALPAMRPGVVVNQVNRLQSRIRSRIGQGDIQLGVPEFDDRFEITTEDETFARAVLTPDVVHFLLTDPRAARGFAIYGDHLNVHDGVSDHGNPEQLIAALDLRCDLLDRIPEATLSQNL